MPEASIIHLMAGVVSAMALGFVWYSMAVFGKPWMKEVGLTQSDIKNGPGAGYFYTTILALVAAFVLARFIGYASVALAKEVTPLFGAQVGLMAGLGFVATAFGTEYIFSQKSSRLYGITAGYQVLNLTVMGLVLGFLMS